MSEVRLIDANGLEKIVRDDIRLYDSQRTYNPFDQMKRDSLVEFAERIDHAPTVNAVPVVRCKECKHRCGTIYARDRITILKVCELRHGTNEQDFYCKDGEREPANGYGVMAARMLE